MLEGDFILPRLGALDSYDGVPAGGRVRTLVVVESDETQLARNYGLREGHLQPERAR